MLLSPAALNRLCFDVDCCVTAGQPLVPALTAIGKWLGDRLRESVQNQTGAGKPLDGLAKYAAAGRKLMEV